MTQEVTKRGPETSLFQPGSSWSAAVEQVTMAHYHDTDLEA